MRTLSLIFPVFSPYFFNIFVYKYLNLFWYSLLPLFIFFSFNLEGCIPSRKLNIHQYKIELINQTNPNILIHYLGEEFNLNLFYLRKYTIPHCETEYWICQSWKCPEEESKIYFPLKPSFTLVIKGPRHTLFTWSR